jgi:hypothetical protein
MYACFADILKKSCLNHIMKVASCNIKNKFLVSKEKGASVAELLTSNQLPLIAVGLKSDRDFGFLHVCRLSS